MLTPFVRNYILTSLPGTPTLIRRLLHDLPVDSPLWDQRPDPDRFTLREIVAHLIDFEEFWIYACQRILSEDNPQLPARKDTHLENCLNVVDPFDNWKQFAALRQQHSAWLIARPEADFARPANHPRLGNFTLEDAVVLNVAHDKYHTQQISDWLDQLTT